MQRPQITLPLLAILLSTLIFVPMSVEAQNNPLTNIPVIGTVESGGTFQGTLTITEFAVDQAGNLLASGTLNGVTSTGIAVINQAFTGAEALLTPGGRQGVCDILTLDLGPLHLDVLGLVIDLDEVHLDITAQRGPGNLLGNLLCALTGLLDNPGSPLGGIQALINAINQILSL